MNDLEPAPPAAIHADMIELLRAARQAERDLYAMLDPERRDAAGTMGDWSARDVLAHLAAWRAVEARRLEATARGLPAPTEDPTYDEPVDDANARLRAERAGHSWEDVERDADASTDALASAIALSAHDVLCECEGAVVVGIGSSGSNHAIGHLMDVAALVGEPAAEARYEAFLQQVERILARRHLRPRDTGIMLYNIACHRALTGDLDEARRLLRIALAQHRPLVDFAPDDPDLSALRDELPALTAAR
jgi:hypothetical protein